MLNNEKIKRLNEELNITSIKEHHFDDFDDEMKKAYLDKKGYHEVHLMNSPSAELQKYILNKDLKYIAFIKNPLPEYQIKAYKSNPLLFFAIDNPTLEVKKMAKEYFDNID